MNGRLHRWIRLAVVLGIVLFFASGALAGSRAEEPGPSGAQFTTQAILFPVRVLKTAAVFHSNTRRHVSTALVQSGVSALDRTVDFLTKAGLLQKSTPDRSAGSSGTRPSRTSL